MTKYKFNVGDIIQHLYGDSNSYAIIVEFCMRSEFLQKYWHQSDPEQDYPVAVFYYLYHQNFSFCNIEIIDHWFKKFS